MLSNKRGCPRRTNVGLNWVSIVPLDWSMDDNRLMHKHVGKRAKMQRKAKWVAQSKQGKHNNVAWSKERVCIKQTDTMKMHLTSGNTQTIHKRGECNYTSKWPQRLTSTSPRRAQSMAKPKSRHAIDIKYRSKKAYTCIKEMIQTLWYRPRCMDVDLDHKI